MAGRKTNEAEGRERKAYRIDLSAPIFRDLAAELASHSQRDRGRRMAELAALGLEVMKRRAAEGSPVVQLGGVAPMAELGQATPLPYPALPSETVGAPVARHEDASETGVGLPRGEQLSAVTDWATDMGFSVM